MRGDPARLRQVLLNLAANAIKFTEPARSSCRRRAVVSETDAGDAARFEVADTGIGISPTDQHRLFDAFSQVDASTTRRFGGTGLGLAISQQLVEAMGGHLTVASELGQGSTFAFTLPLERGGSRRAVPAAPQHLLDGRAVLVVDDNATNRLILHEQLVAWDMKPLLAASGEAALQHAPRRRRPDRPPFRLALLDLNMPGMDGLELARRISQDPTAAGTRAGHADLDRRRPAPELLAAGVTDCLTKPVRSSQLYDCLVKAVTPPLTRHRRARPPGPGPRDRAGNRSGTPARRGGQRHQPARRPRHADRLGYRVDIAANGIEALAALERTSYAAVLMDCQMPEMDGYTRHGGDPPQGARQRPPHADHRHHGRRVPRRPGAVSAAGMDDYIAKPITACRARGRPDARGLGENDRIDRIRGSVLVPGAVVRGGPTHRDRTDPDQVVEVDHDRLLGGAGDHHHRLVVGVRVLLAVRDPWRHEHVVAGRGDEADLLVTVEEDELGMALHDVDAGLGLAVVVVARPGRRRHDRLAHPDLARPDRTTRDRLPPPHPRGLLCPRTAPRSGPGAGGPSTPSCG